MVRRSTVGRVDVVLFSGLWVIAIVYPLLFRHQVPKLSNDLTRALQFGLLCSDPHYELWAQTACQAGWLICFSHIYGWSRMEVSLLSLNCCKMPSQPMIKQHSRVFAHSGVRSQGIETCCGVGPGESQTPVIETWAEAHLERLFYFYWRIHKPPQPKKRLWVLHGLIR